MNMHPARGWRALLWVGAGLSFGLGVLGVLLPGLPATPFLLITSWCLVRASPRMHQRLLDSPLFGPLLKDWNAHRGVRLHVKVTALVLMLSCGVLTLVFADFSTPLRILIGALLCLGTGVVLRLRIIRD
jgi:uncharacterized membrane protein YbaN (DUF454 family)